MLIPMKRLDIHYFHPDQRTRLPNKKRQIVNGLYASKILTILSQYSSESQRPQL